jgi:hypothetical protein
MTERKLEIRIMQKTRTRFKNLMKTSAVSGYQVLIFGLLSQIK